MAAPSRRIFLTAGALLAMMPRRARAASQNKPAAPAPVAVGALLPLSGAGSLTGDECLRGIQLAVDDINAGGGIVQRPVFFSAGDAVSQDAAQGAAKALIDSAHLAVLLGSGSSALSYPVSAAAELAQIPYIELNAPADGINGRGFKFLLRSCATTSMIAAVATGAIAARFKGKKIGLLFNTGATAGAIAAAALSTWQAQKITPLLVAGYPENVPDLHEPVSRLRRAGVEILLHAAGEDDVLQAFQAMQDIGWTPAAVVGCGDGYGLRETAFALGGAFDGTLVAAAPFYPPRAGYLAAAYQARYGMPPRSADSLTAYVGAKLVMDFFSGAGGDAGKLLDTLRRADISTGTLANGWGVQFDKSGQNTRSFATLQQWRGQALVNAG
jgi:branched-chain amino acid transport system substrate-binding protein